jgi:EmrB/QacA subfamily drug resistance transporter
MASDLDSSRAKKREQGHIWLALLAVSLGLMMVLLDTTVVAIANPTIGRDLSASLSQLQWVTNAYLLAVAVAIVPAGKLGDRFGRKRVFLIGVCGFALASMASGLSPTIELLIAFRTLQGLAGALLMPASLAIIRATFPERLLQQAIGIWAGVSAVAIASGPIVGGIIVEHAGWPYVFFLNLLVGAIALSLGSWAISESKAERAGSERFDLPGVAILSIALFALVWGIIKSQTLGWGDIVTLGSLVGAFCAFAVFALRERSARHPLVPLRLFRSISLSTGVVLVLLLTFSLFGVLFFLALYLQRVHGYSPVETGVRTLPLTATIVLAAPLGGFVTARLGPRPPLVAGMALLGGGLLGLSGLHPHSSYIALAPWLFMLGLGIGLVQTAATETVVGNAPVRLAGVAGGLQQTALQIGGALGTAVLGAVLSSRVAAVFPGKLLAAGVPAQAVPPLFAERGYVAQGIAPVGPGLPVALVPKVTEASFQAFVYGLDFAFVVAACIAFFGSVLALIVRRRPQTEEAPPPIPL